MSVLSLGLSLALSLLFIPLIRWLSFRLGQVAQPRDDRWHRRPTPTMGGVGIFLAFICAIFIMSLFYEEEIQKHWGLLAGSFFMFGLGLYDDFKKITPTAKLVGQILGATIVISLGYTSTFFTPRVSNNILAQLPNILFTYIWLIGITNAINLLDNMDGLAGGISLITACFLSYFFWNGGNLSLLWISLALAGSVLGFLFFNFPPASIFMGDSGSMFLGFTLALLAIAQQQQASDVLAVLGVPTLLFLLPILDTMLVMITRLLRGQSPVKGGRDHASHRLIAIGLTERQALLVLYGVAIISGVTAAALESLNYWLSLVLAPVLIITFALLTAYLGGLKVVSPSTPPHPEKPITRIMLELTFKRRLLEIVLDFFLIAVAYYLAFLARSGQSMDLARLEVYLQSLPIALAGAYLSFYVAGVYRGVWRYVDLNDLVRYFQAVVGSVILLAAGLFILSSSDYYLGQSFFSPGILLLYGIFLFFGLAATRSSFRIIELFSPKRRMEKGSRVLIYGAGDIGEMAVRWILRNPQLEYHLVGFLDDDPFMTGRRIHGIDVLGSSQQAEQILEEFDIRGVIITDDHPEKDSDHEILTQACHRRGCWLRRLHLEFEEM